MGGKRKSEEKIVLQPTILAPMVQITVEEQKGAKDADCVVHRLDENGIPIPGSEFTTSSRMWDRTYSKNNKFTLKKK